VLEVAAASATPAEAAHFFGLLESRNCVVEAFAGQLQCFADRPACLVVHRSLAAARAKERAAARCLDVEGEFQLPVGGARSEEKAKKLPDVTHMFNRTTCRPPGKPKLFAPLEISPQFSAGLGESIVEVREKRGNDP